jgi:hypothetical protein
MLKIFYRREMVVDPGDEVKQKIANHQRSRNLSITPMRIDMNMTNSMPIVTNSSMVAQVFAAFFFFA